MIYYAIRHITTGNYLPPGGKKLGGHTKQECCSLNVRPPRLFTTKKKALSALKYYLQGIWYEKSYTTYFGEYDTDFGVKANTARKPEEYKVVKMRLSLQK